MRNWKQFLNNNVLCFIMLTRKSESNWLNRLRSAKGFPADHHLNLEHFLNLHHVSRPKLSDTTFPSNDPTILNSSQSQNPGQNRTQSPAIQPEYGDGGVFNAMSNVLAELFVMGDTQNFPKKKAARKQTNPRTCAVSASPDAGNSQPENVQLQMSCNNEREQVFNRGALDGEDEDTGGTDLSGFSRTEVTVIDTSYESWKFEKMLFRRKNVWKVHDKKCKDMISVCRKKRKGSEDTAPPNEKTTKLSSWKCSSSKMPLNEGLHQSDRIKEVCKQGPDTHNQISKARLPRKLKKVGSSVILGKGIRTPAKISTSN